MQCFWSLQCYNHSNVVFHQSLMVRVIPLILYGKSREDNKTKELVQMTATAIAWTPFRECQILAILDAVLDLERSPKLINNASWKMRQEVLTFLLQFCARNAVVLNRSEKYLQRIVDYLSDHCLKDKQLEVRLTARNVLTALIQTTRLKEAESVCVLQRRFEKLARTKVPRRNFESVDSGFDKKVGVKLRKKHCGILGLSALVLSCPYTVPEWLPDVLSFIALFERERAPIGTTCKKTVSEFKRTHQDEWHLFKEQFTLDQLSSIQDASSNSYFV